MHGASDKLKENTGVYIITISSPQRGKNVRVMGKKKTLERRGNEGGRERRGKGKREREMMNDSILMNNSMNINRWIINIWIFIIPKTNVLPINYFPRSSNRARIG